jgi:hypothetical protein
VIPDQKEFFSVILAAKRHFVGVWQLFLLLARRLLCYRAEFEIFVLYLDR